MPTLRLLSGYTDINGATVYSTSCGVTNSGTYNSGAILQMHSFTNVSCYGGDPYSSPSSFATLEIQNPSTTKKVRFKKNGAYCVDGSGNIYEVLPGTRGIFDVPSLHTTDYDYTVEAITADKTATPTITTTNINPTNNQLAGTAVAGSTVKLYKGGVYTGTSVTATGGNFTFSGLTFVSGEVYTVTAQATGYLESDPSASKTVQYGNTVQSGDFIKNDCAINKLGTSVTFTVSANSYFASTLAAANTLAINAVASGGQAYANTNGSCTMVQTNKPIFQKSFLMATEGQIQILTEPNAVIDLYLFGIKISSFEADENGFASISKLLTELEEYTCKSTAINKYTSVFSDPIRVYKQDSEAELAYKKIDLARNHIVKGIEAVSPLLYPEGERNNLRYELELFAPLHFLSSEYYSVDVLNGAEEPPKFYDGTTIYPGANFDIAAHLDSLLKREAPAFGMVGIKLVSGVTMPYRITTRQMDDLEVLTETESPLLYAIKAGVAESDFAQWGDAVFTNYFGVKKGFLTFQENNKLVNIAQPEFLYYLTNFSPLPSKIRLVVKEYDEAKMLLQRREITAIDSVFAFSVYCVAVGVEALNIDYNNTYTYEVYLCDEYEQCISEKRRYIIDRDFQRQTRFVIYANSLGGFETLYLRGIAQENLQTTKTLSEHFTGWVYLPENSEITTDEVQGERSVTINTGFLTQEQRKRLDTMLLSEEIFIVSDRAFLPLRLADENYISLLDDEFLGGRAYTFTYNNKEKNYSELPNPSIIPVRATGWRAKAYACAWDANGRRTGTRVVSLIEQYYLDDNSKVPFSPIKANVPGTDGYLPPSYHEDCATTPYLSEGITALCAFSRNNCPNETIGNNPTITIADGEFGSEISQIDADAKAQEEFARLNTQAYANQYGTCTIFPNDYEKEVPAGSFAYRANLPNRVMLYYTPIGDWVNIYEGNTGPKVPFRGSNIVVPGPRNYPAYTDDVLFTVPAPSNRLGWFYFVFGTPNKPFKVNIYINGVLYFTENRNFNLDGFEFFNLFPAANIESGKRIYIKLIDL